MSTLEKQGFKQTEIGVIPEDWNYSKLSEVCVTSSGTTPPRSQFDRYFRNGHINWVKTLDLNNSEIIKTDEQVTKEALTETSLKLYLVKTVLVAMYGGFNQIGRTGILRVPACVNQAITAIQCDNKLSPEYLLATLNFKVEHWKTVASSSRKDPNITSQDVRDFQIAYPSRNEQEQIAESLSCIDSLIRNLDQLIAKKRNIQQATMQQLLTGQRRLPGFSGEWEVKRLGDFGQCLRGVSYKGDADLLAYDTDETYRLLRSNNVQQSAIDVDGLQFVNARCVSSHQVLKPKDILICMANGSKDLVGKAGLFKFSDGHRYTFGAFMGCFRMKSGTEPDFIFALFGTYKYKNYIANLLAGSSINNLRPSDIEQMEFRFPPNNEQAAIAAMLSDMDSELAALEGRRDKARHIKQGMMQELLTGRTRLI